MAADEEFRKVAEDVRELARALRSELRSAKWEAKAAARDAKRDWREYRRSGLWPPAQDWSQRYGPGRWTPPMGPWGPPPPPPAAPRREGAAPGDPGPPAPPAGPDAGPPPGSDPGAPSAGGAGAPSGAHGWGGHQWFPWGPYHGPPPGMRPMPVTAPVRPPKPPRPAAPPVRHKRDGSTLLSLLLVLVGLAWLGSASGIVSLSLETVLATVLVVLGAVMVITARTDWSLSRKHWPVWLGVAVLVLVVASANSGGLANGVSNLHFGPTAAAPTTWADAATPVGNFAGPITLDLTRLVPTTGDETLRVHDVFGPITVTLPADPNFHVHIRAHTAFGPVSLPGAPSNNGGMFTHRTADIGPDARPTLTLELVDAFGPISVSQLSP